MDYKTYQLIVDLLDEYELIVDLLESDDVWPSFRKIQLQVHEAEKDVRLAALLLAKKKHPKNKDLHKFWGEK